MKKYIAVVLCFCAVLAFAAVKITDNGRPAAEIVTEPGTGAPGQLAAKELQYWLKEISGAELPIISKQGASQARIILRLDKALKLNADGFVVSEPEKGKTILISAAHPRGILTGAWRLLFRNTDIIWARPDEKIGTIFSKQKTLVFKETNFRFNPQLTLRGFQYHAYSRANELWQARNGSNRGSFMVRNGKFQYDLFDEGFTANGHHNLIRIYMPEHKYWETHPEFYVLMSGKRKRPSSQSFLTNLCFTNPECQKEFLKNFMAEVEANKEYDTIGIIQEDILDGCECPECMKPIPTTDGKFLTVKDKNFRSTQFFRWLNPIAKELRKKYPNKKIKTLAYWLTEPAPGCPVESNVEITYCPINRDSKYSFDHKTNAAYNKNLQLWVKTGAGLIWREYYGLTGEFPRPADRTMSQDLQYLISRHGIRGTRSEMYADMNTKKRQWVDVWNQNSLYFYVMANLQMEPFRPVEEIRQEFLSRVYGEAAPFVGEYYSLLEKAWHKSPGYSHWDDHPQASWNKCFQTDPQLKGKLSDLLAKAQKCKMPENGRKNLELLTVSFKKMGTGKTMTIPVPKTSEKVEFDPQFSSGAWKHAAVIDGFDLGERFPKVKANTALKILYDAQSIYFGFRCTDPNGLKVIAAPEGSSRDQWYIGNKLEILMGTADGKRLQLAVDCNGNIFDAYGKDRSWEGFFDIPVKKDPHGWSMMIKVPFAYLGYEKVPKSVPFYALRYYIDSANKSLKGTQTLGPKVPVQEVSVYPVLELK